MNEDNIHVPTTPTDRDCGTTGPDNRRDRIRTARHCMSIYYRAHALLVYLKTRRIRATNPAKRECCELMVQFDRLAGNMWIDPKHPCWKTISTWLSDRAWSKPPIFGKSEMLEVINGARAEFERANRTTHMFLDRLERLILNRIDKKSAES